MGVEKAAVEEVAVEDVAVEDVEEVENVKPKLSYAEAAKKALAFTVTPRGKPVQLKFSVEGEHESEGVDGE